MSSQLKSMIQTIKRNPLKSRGERPGSVVNGTPVEEKTGILHDITHLSMKDKATMAQAITTLASGEPIDDKKLMLENGVTMLQGLPPNSGLSQKVSDGFITMLWHDLPHPYPTTAGPEARYRRHDGGGNVPWNTELGKAGSPYARNVPPMKPKGPNLPDVESVYEALLKREGPFRKHPSGLNRMFFSFATVVIHECFQTSRKDPSINETSSYVDLSTLYGNTDKEQVRVRTYNNGLIHPDSIASERIMMMPPGVIAVLLMFSRNHNRIARNLLSINEGSKYKPWDSLDDAGKKWQDEDIFQLTRNINVGYFASCVLGDYVAAILNTPRANSEWSLNLGKEIKEGAKRVERGSGNLVSVEFAVLYHWHAALSAADDKWMEELIRYDFPDLKDLEDVTVEMFHKVMKTWGHKLMVTPPKDWTFGGLDRQADGTFNDTELAEIIKSCIEEPAHEFGAHGTPASLKVVDIMGQLQARNVFNVCTLNEFRKYLNLKEYETFEDWNPDKETARRAELLYGHIDNMELYPGLMAECTKPAIPGSGVCPGQTTGRGILDDAVALVRGDRFLTYDFNSNTLTNWGASSLSERAPGAYGGILPVVLMNGIPGEFTGTSSYSLLPFYTPEAAQGILKGNKVTGKYISARPPTGKGLVSVQSEAAVKQILGDADGFKTPYPSEIPASKNGHDFLNGWNDLKRHDSMTSPIHKSLIEEGFEKNVSLFFSSKMKALIEKNTLSFKKGRKSIDIVRDVTNVVPIFWVADRFAVPLKTAETPRGVFTPFEAFGNYLGVYLYQNFNVLPVLEWRLRESAVKAASSLLSVFETHLKTQKGITETVVDWLAKGSAFQVGPHADRLYHALNDSKQAIPDSAADMLNMSAPLVSILTHQASLLIDLYLSPGYEQYKERLVQLANADAASSEQELRGFVYEGIRLAPAVLGVPRVASKDITINDGARGPIKIQSGQTVLAATSAVGLDPTAFPEPEKVNPTRPLADYAVLGSGLNSCYGSKLIGAALASTLREVFKLKNVRKAAGKLGNFTVAHYDIAGLQWKQYLDDNAKESPVPTSLTLEYDA
ncbi:hypothetical protein AOL_s00173g34 [Orbilia oligospora ATCC 24927]|uniref:Linoleate diol synthase n=2 Tax=Orbilia oligospora TaxID=2813651 RepID=G1XNL6_ARTOA|nr:hypothetical protein AOL_s00173g34 [Orbilia oligospora ATCC 24927]EGX44933.1 hypothetical protein AOL_s00173g34 [Orbilia oligospora ATCC 24927]KAF3286628.1 hypothetical protein TWF970_008478 [Orbilia oligospora]